VPSLVMDEVSVKALELLQAETCMASLSMMRVQKSTAAISVALDAAANAEREALHCEMLARQKSALLGEEKLHRTHAEMEAEANFRRAVQAELALNKVQSELQSERQAREETMKQLAYLKATTSTSDAATITEQPQTMDITVTAQLPSSEVCTNVQIDRQADAAMTEAAKEKAIEGHLANRELNFALAQKCFEQAFNLLRPDTDDHAIERATYLCSASNMALKRGAVEDAKRGYRQVLALPGLEESIRQRVLRKLADRRLEVSLPRMRSDSTGDINDASYAQLSVLVRRVEVEARSLAQLVQRQTTSLAFPSQPELKHYTESGIAIDAYTEPIFLEMTPQSPNSVTDEASMNAFQELDEPKLSPQDADGGPTPTEILSGNLKSILAILTQSRDKMRQLVEINASSD